MDWTLCFRRLVGLSLMLASLAHAQPYGLSIVVQTGSVVDGETLGHFRGDVVIINDEGDIGYAASLPDADGILTVGQGLVVRDGYDIDGVTLLSHGTPQRLTNSGDFVFVGTFNDGQGIFSPTRLYIRTGETVANKLLFTITHGVMNDVGTVTFIASFLGGNGVFILGQPEFFGTGITISGKTLTRIVGNATINNAGTPAFDGAFAPVLTTNGAFTSTAFLAGTGTVHDGHIIETVGYTTINNLGEVAYLIRYPGGTAIVTTTQGTVVRTGDQLPGLPPINFLDAPVINDTGEVIYKVGGTNWSGVASSTHGVVFTAGQAVEGRRVRFADRPSVNNHGAIVFRVIFDDIFGEEGIVLATPPPGPFLQIVTADLNADGVMDTAGIDTAARIWRCLQGWQWQQLPGWASSIMAGDLYDDGRQHLIVGEWTGQIWVSSALGPWYPLEGYIMGNFAGTGTQQLMGLAPNKTLWYSVDAHAWQPLGAWLEAIWTERGVTEDTLLGAGSGGTGWRLRHLSQWERVW